MANTKTENFIDELSDAQIEALAQLQTGLPDGVIPAQTIQSLDERDLINRIQYTSPRSQIAIAGWALSEDGNKVVEELARREYEEQRTAAGQAKEPPKAEKKKAAVKKQVKKEDSDSNTD